MPKNRIATLFVISIIYISYSNQIQNLCGDNPEVDRVKDPSSCHLYLFCTRVNSTVVPKFGSCYYPGNSFIFVTGWYTNLTISCTNGNSQCIDPLWACPPSTEHDILVADPYDPTCRRHRQCRNLSGNYFQCSESLVFNRNTGLCDLPENAPCTRVMLPVRCPSGYTGFYPGNFCYAYVYCSNGDILLNLECEPGMYFDETAKSCLYDNNNICSRYSNALEDSMPKNEIEFY